MSFLDWFKRKPKNLPIELPAAPQIEQPKPEEVKKEQPERRALLTEKVDRKFVKGNVGGPGRPRIPIADKLATIMTQKEFARISLKFSTLTKEEIRDLYQDPDSTALETAMAKIWHVAMAKGDEKKMEFLLNRMIGKVKDVVKVEDVIDPDTDKYKKALARLREIKEEKTSGDGGKG